MSEPTQPAQTTAEKIRSADIAEQLRLETKRADKMREVASMRWMIAVSLHKTELGENLDFKRWPFLVEIYQSDAPDLVLTGSAGWGKASPLDAKVHTPNGWKQMGKLQVGDRVSTPDGCDAPIIGIFPQGEIPIYRIALSDGRSTEACGQHLWRIVDSVRRFSVVNTIEIADRLKYGKGSTLHLPDMIGKSAEWNAELRTKLGIQHIASVEPIGNKPAQCILIDHPDHLYITDDFIVTHNTEFSICDDAAKAACDLRVFHVMDNLAKRDRLVLGRVDPCFAMVSFYAGMLKVAKNKNRDMDSSRFKHFGDLGSINFVNSNSDSDFSTYRADSAVIDEHQDCDQKNLGKVFHRMTGSDFGFVILMGNPRSMGTAENQNLHWHYLQTDQRQWHVPCPTCGVEQILGWWSHFIEEKKNEHGAIVSMQPRDQTWDPKGYLEFRPVCPLCTQPMYRLAPGRWIPTNPGAIRRGYQLSSLYNPTAMLTGEGTKSLLSFYRRGMHNPNDMSDFVNNQLGMPYNLSGSSITEEMLQAASTGIAADVAPYRFLPASEIRWRDVA